MAIKRYFAEKDNTITNAFEPNLVTRGTGSNMGLADSVEVFSIYAQASSSSLEAARTLIQFPVTSSEYPNITTILQDRNNGKIPASGSVNFYLRMFNVATDQTVPRNFTLVVSPVSQSWEEGRGVDLDNYSDLTYDGTGSNWINARANTPWTNQGGDFLTASLYTSYNYTQTFDKGIEDLEVDITGLVEQWITGTAGGGYGNYGVGVFLTSSQESGSQSYYTKRFSARDSEYFFSRPVIEARWDNSKKDNRGNFIVSSSALSANNNLNTLYIYNYHRGQLTNIANVETGSIFVTLHNSSSGGSQITATPDNPVTGGWVSTGIYSASFALNTTASTVYDRWFSGSTYYNTGSFSVSTHDPRDYYNILKYVTTVTNLKEEYSTEDTAQFRLFTRLKDWSPTIYTVASTEIQNYFVEDAFYKIVRVIDNKDVISYGTGSTNHTKLSYDVSGSYFDLDMSLLEPGYLYSIKFIYYLDGSYEEQKETFNFRVE
tara:strand:+ start:238 stop:1701 length:1464 start_codon:yes stop_codon:yes gene_type:complete